MWGEGGNGCVEKGRMDVGRRGKWMCGEGENGCVGVLRMDSRCVGVKKKNVCM